MVGVIEVRVRCRCRGQWGSFQIDGTRGISGLEIESARIANGGSRR